MVEATNRRLIWRGIFIKILIILVFPISFSFYSNYWYGGVLAPTINNWISLLIQIEYDSIEIAMIDAFLPAFILMLPGILFERKIRKSSISSHVRKSALLAALVTWLLAFSLQFTLPSVIYYYDSFYSQLMAIDYVPTLAIPLFIVLPLLNRELVLKSASPETLDRSFANVSKNFTGRFRWTRYLPLLLFIALMFSPIVLLYPYGGYFLLSPICALDLIGYRVIPLQFFPIDAAYFNLNSFFLLPITLIVFSLRAIFIRDVFRYHQVKLTQQRLISTGLLAEISPAVIMSILSSIPGSGLYFIVPTPILPIIGYLFVRHSKLPTMTDEIWDDEEYRMWFEGEQPAPTPYQPRMEQDIKVPLTYIIASQFRKLKRH
ncbi:MAG: hypothetical protein ACFFCP_10105 [Promethearchaeota archaeon]